MDDVFSTLYFDLEFLQAKLRVTGPADLIRDFKKYRGLITNGVSCNKTILLAFKIHKYNIVNIISTSSIYRLILS